MIDFKSLDKAKTYLVLQYGEGFISRKIRKYSRQYAPTAEKFPTHVLALVYSGGWFIYESHARAVKKLNIGAGVRKIPVNLWKIAERTRQRQYFAYPLDLDREELEKHLGEPYSVGDIQSLFFAALRHDNGKQKDCNGLICSEYMALCTDNICKYYNLPAHCITPAHFQDYIENVLEVA